MFLSPPHPPFFPQEQKINTYRPVEITTSFTLLFCVCCCLRLLFQRVFSTYENVFITSFIPNTDLTVTVCVRRVKRR